MRWPWQKNEKLDESDKVEKELQEQKNFIEQKYKVNHQYVNEITKNLNKEEPTLAEMAIINNLAIYLYPKLILDIPILRKIILYSIIEFKDKSHVLIQKLAMLPLDERYQVISQLKFNILDVFQSIYQPKSSEETPNYISEIIENYFDKYI